MIEIRNRSKKIKKRRSLSMFRPFGGFLELLLRYAKELSHLQPKTDQEYESHKGMIKSSQTK
jgi:hypothetical protein